MSTASEIMLDAKTWRNKLDFYSSYCSATQAPSWFGNNLDAFHDSLRGGICKVTPEKIVIQNLTRRIKECLGHEFWKSIEDICHTENVELEM